MKKNFMKVIAIVLCLMMAIPAASLFVGAEEAPKWEGEIATEFAGGKGTAGDPFQITTGDHLALLSDAINYGVDGEYVDLGGLYFKVMNDIDMNGVPFEPIGGEIDSSYFSGNFDGNGKTIYNLNLMGEFASSFMNVGLFGCTKDAVIKNVNIGQMVATNGLTSTAYFNVGTLIGKAINTKVVNCHIQSDMGLAACLPQSQTTLYAGGLIGMIQDGGLVKGCTYKGTMVMHGRGDPDENNPGNRVAVLAGALVGRADADAGNDSMVVTIEDCIVDGKISLAGPCYHSGFAGILGVWYNGWGATDAFSSDFVRIYFRNLLVSADIDISEIDYSRTPPGDSPNGNQYTKVGGITAWRGSGYVSFDNCHTTGEFKGVGEDFKGTGSCWYGGISGPSAGSKSTYVNCSTSLDRFMTTKEERNEDDSIKFKENWTGVFDEATCLVNNTSMRELAKATIEANIAALAEYDDEYDPDMWDIINPWYDGPMTDDETGDDTTDDTADTTDDTVDTTDDTADTTDVNGGENAGTEPAGSDDEPAKGGCGGSITMAGIAMVAALGAAAVVVAKKKED